MLILLKFSVNITDPHQLKMTSDSPENRVKRKKNSIKLGMEIKRRLFILSWIRSYDTDMMIGDVIAGITLGLTMIPQAIAYAGLAGLPSQYGLYSAFVGTDSNTFRLRLQRKNKLFFIRLRFDNLCVFRHRQRGFYRANCHFVYSCLTIHN